MIHVLSLLMCISSFALAGQKEEATTRRSAPPVKMVATLPKTLSREKAIPLTLTLTYESDEARQVKSYSFDFIVLDEAGVQVARDAFFREAVEVDVPLKGRNPSYKPDFYCHTDSDALKPGRRYQLLVLMPESHLATAVWFTLTD